MRVIIVRGPSGSGKSSLIQKRYPNAKVVSADHYFMINGEYVFDPVALPLAHAQCFRLFLQLLVEKHPLVVVDNTATKTWEWENYALAAKLAEYKVLLVEMIVQSVDWIQRCASRNVHHVPLMTIAKQALDFETAGNQCQYTVERMWLF
jgi:predicted ABC-type ATPase